MGSLFRSEKMTQCEIMFSPESVYECVSALGEEGLVQFLDLNANVNAFNRQFTMEVQMCDELERDIRFFHSEIVKENIPIEVGEYNPRAPRPKELLELEKLYRELVEVDSNIIALRNNYINFLQHKAVLRRAKTCFGDTRARKIHETEDPEGREELGKSISSNFCFIGGIVEKKKLFAFEKVLWRVCKGNMLMYYGDMEGQPDAAFIHEEIEKSSFIVCCQGEQLMKNVKKVCEGYGSQIYLCPTKMSEIKKSLIEVTRKINDLNKVLLETEFHKQSVLKDGAKYIRSWIIEIRKMKGIYHTMNYFDMHSNEKFIIAQCWIPYIHINDVYNTIVYNSIEAGVNKNVKPIITETETLENPPTYFKLNKFTRAFQKIIEAYGVASYEEINPTLFTIITFPFLFGIMFGDMGHSIIMVIFAVSMIHKEKKYEHRLIENEIFKMLFGGRYVILMMGIFSFYTGFIYNELFSLSLNIFGSTWRVNYNESTIQKNEFLQLNPSSNDFLGLPPPFGVDPVWKNAQNNIDRTNVIKMKISIIVGVIQMLFGIILSLFNHIHFKNYVSIYCEFIPQLIFFLLLFVYLVVLVFVKWILFSPSNDVKRSPHCAPSILITFIDMVLVKGMDVPSVCDSYMYPKQEVIQRIFLVVALLCVPWMLIAKPLILFHRRKHNPLPEGEEVEEPSDIFIHQCIHTIEFVLGSVSYTASYLRLWALSLAHGQLAEVLWNRVMRSGFTKLNEVGGIIVFFAFGIWACLTVSILVVMEGLSAFLHALRLHWMEFQSKFYVGQGYSFDPFTFQSFAEDVDNLIMVC